VVGGREPRYCGTETETHRGRWKSLSHRKHLPTFLSLSITRVFIIPSQIHGNVRGRRSNRG